MSKENPVNYEVAIRDFKRARKQAAVQHLLAQLTGRSNELLAYGDVYKQLGGEGTIERGIQEIPLKAIVGSVGRYDDFTRDFLPKKDSIQERWARVKALILDMAGMGPISVYQIGDVYFVRDGNHRVSIAKQLGTSTISALVTEVKTKVPLTIDDGMNEVQRKARYTEFLKKTKLDEWRPFADLQLTFCKNYHVFYSQIEAHRKESDTNRQATVTFEEAAAKWYDQIYLPVAGIIREQGIMKYFPERTEADMYLLFVEHQDELESALGWHIDPDSTVVDMMEEKADEPHGVLEWLGLQLYETFLPDQLHAGPEAGHWRKMHLAHRKHDTLFSHILVGLPYSSQEWRSLDHAAAIAKREQGYIYGLHVVKNTTPESSLSVDKIRQNFTQRCQAASIEGELTVEKGDIAETILKRAAWVDLVVVSLTHPPEQKTLKRLGVGFTLLIQRCSRPMLVVPDGADSQMDRILLAYDGSPKANEALFVAAYLGSKWNAQLVVVTVETKHTPKTALELARTYLEKQGIDNVAYLLRPKPIGNSLLKVAEEYNSNLLIMGGFGFRPVLNLVLGSTVDQILHEFKQPILICR
ncbi:MAG TPA: universal stress protein [Anaerolineales bacterium]|nr:universal stress protein [Anaerolineales bacterium]